MKTARFSIILLTAVVFYAILGVSVMAQETAVDGSNMVPEPELFKNVVFSDVDETHENYDAISYVAGRGIVEGYMDGTYKPDQSINRAEFTKILVGAAYDYDPSGDDSEFDIYSLTGFNFSDIEDQAWYLPFLRKAVEKGVIEGYEDGTYKPSRNVNFAEAAKIIVVSFGFEYTEDEEVWYKPYVDILEKRRVIPDTISSFDQAITRGEMAEMIYRIKAIITNKTTATYDQIASYSEEAEESLEIHEPAEEEKVSLYFGNPVGEPADDSYPVYVMDCFTDDCPMIPFFDDESVLNTKGRLAFDLERDAVYYPLNDSGVNNLMKFELSSGATVSAGFENSYDMSYRPYIYGDLMVLAASTEGKETVVKHDLLTGSDSSIPVFDGYDKCTWPAIDSQSKVYAVCSNLDTNYYIVDEDGENYYSSDKHLESLVISLEGIAYFVEEGFVKVLDLETKFVRGTDVIPPYHIVYSLTISPDGNYLAGMGEISGEWAIGIYDRNSEVLTMPVELKYEPGIPSFGPYIDSVSRSVEESAD